VVANYLYENGPLVRRGVQRADAVYAAAKCLIPKAQAVYRLRTPPRFLPTPIEIPESVQKASEPTVCFVGRLDRRKKPEVFFGLAERFPDVRFIAVGESSDPAWDQYLRDRYGSLANLELRGFVDQFRTDELSEILSRSWMLVNTSAREGLPNSLLEAAAHRCAILSAVDPDDFASRFGFYVQSGDFETGLRFLVEHDRWRERGIAGWRYVADTFETSRAIESHLEAYGDLVDSV
jgi:glycosyltransferase involved in cell wall biosynthesis